MNFVYHYITVLVEIHEERFLVSSEARQKKLLVVVVVVVVVILVSNIIVIRNFNKVTFKEKFC